MPDEKNVNGLGGANDPILSSGPMDFGDPIIQNRPLRAQEPEKSEPDLVVTESFVDQGQAVTAYQINRETENMYTPPVTGGTGVNDVSTAAWQNQGGVATSQVSVSSLESTQANTSAPTETVKTVQSTSASKSSHQNTAVTAIVSGVEKITAAVKISVSKVHIWWRRQCRVQAVKKRQNEPATVRTAGTRIGASKALDGQIWRRLLTAGVALLVVVGVFSLVAVFKRPARESVYLRDEYRRDEVDLDSGNLVATAGICQPIPEATVAATVDDFAQTLESDVYKSVTIDEQMREDFAFFAHYSLWTNARHCFYLEYCYNEFASNTPFMLGFARRVFAGEFLGETKKVSDETALRQPANQLRSRVEKYFGVKDIDVSKFPEESGAVYDAEDDSILLSVDEGKDGPYHYDLAAVYEHPTLGQRVFVADAVFNGKCTLRVNENKCTCPAARYYLVQDVDPVSGERIFSREYIQIVGEMKEAK